jgi:hypothetical protein
MIVILSSAAVALVVGLIILVGSRSVIQPTQVEMARKGAEEFDSYAGSIQITNINRSTAERLHNKIGIIRCRVQNTGDRAIVGLQLRGVALGFNNEALKETVITPIPKVRDSLEPNQSMPIELYLDPIPDPSQVSEMTIEVHGLKVR